MKTHSTRGLVEGIHFYKVGDRVYPVVAGGDGPRTKTELEAEKLMRVKTAGDIAAKADGEHRSLNSDEKAQITTLVTEAKGFHEQILALDGDAALRNELSILGQPSGSIATSATAEAGKGMTLGEKFVNAEQFTGWLKQVAPDGHIGQKQRLESPAVAFGMKDLVTGASVTSAGALVNSEWLGLLDGLAQFQRPLTIMDLITKGTTGSDTVEYARVTGFTNNAAPVAEALTDLAVGAAAGGSIGTVDSIEAGVKPKSGLALEKKTATVKTIAHWLPATKRSLSDAGQIRTLIDEFLKYGLDEELEDQVLTGDGTDENFEGIFEVSGTQAQAWDTDLLTTTRKARTKVRIGGRSTPTAFVFHPNDNERIDLLKNSNGDFYFGGPTSSPSAPLWGLPRVESEAMTEGVGMVADWRKAVLWNREQAGIMVSDSHADFFVRNLVAILAEMRAAFGVIRPKAFCTIDLTA